MTTIITVINSNLGKCLLCMRLSFKSDYDSVLESISIEVLTDFSNTVFFHFDFGDTTHFLHYVLNKLYYMAE